MVSGFLISPNDQDRIFSGLESEMRIWSKVGAATTGLKIFRTSWFIDFPVRQSFERRWGGTDGPLPSHHGFGVKPTDQRFSSSTLRPSERISLTSTLKLSGIPASKASSPR